MIDQAVRSRVYKLIIIVALAILGTIATFSTPIGWPGWFVMSAGIGFSLGRWKGLILAPAPVILGGLLRFAYGRTFFWGELWWLVPLITSSVGLLGISAGVLLRQAVFKLLR